MVYSVYGKDNNDAPLIYKAPSDTPPKANSSDNSVFNFSNGNSDFSLQSFIKSDAEITNQPDGLSKEISGWYVLKDDQARQNQLNAHLAKFKTADEQLKELQRLISKGITKNDATLLAGTLGQLQQGIQIQAVENMIDNKNFSKEVKQVSDNEVAKNVKNLHKDNQIQAEKLVMQKTNKETKMIMAQEVPNFADENQVEGSKIVVATNDIDIIKSGASVASQCSVANQTQIVKTYQEIENKEVNKLLIDQYGDYAKENQLDIHKIMSSSKLSETVEYAASNIWLFDKDNQAQAVRITTDTGNEAAINAASAQYAKYDKSAQEEIKTIINNTDCDSAKETLADIEAEKQAKTEAEAKAAETSKTNDEKTTVTEKVKEIIDSKSTNKDALIQKTLKNATEGEKIALIASLPPNELVNVLDIILQDNPSLNVLSKAMTALDRIDDKRKNEFVEKINKTYLSKIMGTQIGLFSSNVQETYVKENVKNGNAQSINKNLLSLSAKEKYNNLINGQR